MSFQNRRIPETKQSITNELHPENSLHTGLLFFALLTFNLQNLNVSEIYYDSKIWIYQNVMRPIINSIEGRNGVTTDDALPHN